MGSHWPNVRQLEHQNKVIIMNDNPLNKIGIHKFTEIKCNMYSCIVFWSRKETLLRQGNLNGLCGVGGSTVPTFIS